MEQWMIFVSFILCMLVPTVILSLVVRTVPKMHRAKPNVSATKKMAELEKKCRFRIPEEAELKRMQQRIRRHLFFPTVAIMIDVLAIIGFAMNGMFRQDGVPVLYAVLSLLGILALSCIPVIRGLRMGRVYRTPSAFVITQGMIVTKRTHYTRVPRTAARYAIHDVSVVVYNEEHVCIFVRDQIQNRVKLQKLGEEEYCWVILYRGYPVAVV